MAIAIVAGALANKPNSGGEAWVRLSWILGLRRLGLDVHFVETISASSCVDASGAPAEFEDSVNLRHFSAVSEEFGLAPRATLLYEGGAEHRGLDPAALLELLSEADLLVNISGHLSGELIAAPRKRVYVDLDPGFTQAWHADPSVEFSVPEHDLYLTVAQNIGRPGCAIPSDGLPWVPTLPPVLLEEWGPAPRPPGPLVLTTVATWRNPYGGLEIGGREMGLKHHQFRRLAELPERVTGAELEIALDIHAGDAADLELLRSHGWRVVDPRAAAASPAAFRDYVRRSSAEFSVAQGVYVDTSSGWFSDRTAAYLASGRPAVIQGTGLEGEAAAPGALFAFEGLEGAVAGVEALREDYERSSADAREFAEESLDSDRVLRRVLELVLALLVAIVLPLLSGTGGADAAATPRVEVVSQPQTVFDWAESACEPMMYPDLPARAFRDYRGQAQLLISHFDNFRLIGPSLDQLTVDCRPVLLSHRSALPSRFQDREWIGSVFTRDGKTVWALLHDEYQGNRHRGRCPSHSYYRCWYNAITFARSSDGGRSYQEAPPPAQLVAAAPRRYRPEVGPRGVFTPSNIVVGPGGAKYALVRIRGPGGGRGTCLIRTATIQRPDSWRAWDGDGFDGRFSNPYETRQRRRTPCAPVGVGRIAEMAESLTYSTVLGRYLLVGLAPPGEESIGPKLTGIYFSTSADLVHWSERKLVTRAVTPHNYSCGGPSPLAYPSLIDPESGSRTFATTGAHPYLYYTQFRYRECHRTAERDLMRVALEVSP
jgi:hypothetical protein